MKSSAAISFFAVVAALRAQTNFSAGTSSTVWVVPQVVREIGQTKKQQFIAFDPHYEESKAERIAQFRPLAKQIFAKEASGEDVLCAHWIYQEFIWLISSSADFKRMDQRLRDLELNLASTVTNGPDSKQVNGPECLTEWWERLEWDYAHVKSKDPIPPEILDRVNSPEKLKAYLTSVSVSDISRTGRDNWLEFNMSLADLIRWIVRDRPDDKAFHPKLKETMLDLVLHRFQDAETGYWGQRYVINGREQFVPDLSTTFHIVSYLDGNVPNLDKIVATTLATKDMDTPVGWLYNGRIYNHNSVDVVELLKWGWPHATPEQKQAIAVELQKLIRLCLAESLQPDGSFKRLEVDASIEEGTYFGAEFLSRTGFFDKSKRFWTDQEFPEAEEIRQRIVGYIEKHRASGATGGVYYDSVLATLKK